MLYDGMIAVQIVSVSTAKFWCSLTL